MPSTRLPPMAKELKQCQNCFKTGTETAPLLSCTCKLRHYCSKDCQKADWKNHKVLCKMTRNTREEMKKNPNNSAMSLVGVDIADANNVMKKWVQQFRPLLSWGVIHALQLQSSSERCLTHILVITMVPTFVAETFPRKDAEIRRAFVVEDARVLSMDEFEEIRPGSEASFQSIKRDSKALRAKDPNAIGYSIVVIIAPACNVLRMTPLGVEGPPLELPSWEPQWKQILETNISQGTAL